MTSKTLPYSYHSFLFPFIWNDGGRTSFSVFIQCLGEKWKTCDWEKEDVLPDFFHSEEEEYGYQLITVSYTHLDVYKRQLFIPS